MMKKNRKQQKRHKKPTIDRGYNIHLRKNSADPIYV